MQASLAESGNQQLIQGKDRGGWLASYLYQLPNNFLNRCSRIYEMFTKGMSENGERDIKAGWWRNGRGRRPILSLFCSDFRYPLPGCDLDLKTSIMINAEEQRFKGLAFVME